MNCSMSGAVIPILWIDALAWKSPKNTARTCASQRKQLFLRMAPQLLNNPSSIATKGRVRGESPSRMGLPLVTLGAGINTAARGSVDTLWLRRARTGQEMNRDPVASPRRCWYDDKRAVGSNSAGAHVFRVQRACSDVRGGCRRRRRSVESY